MFSFETEVECDDGIYTCSYKVDLHIGIEQRIGKRIGEGSYSVVYTMDKNNIVKFVPLGKETCTFCNMSKKSDFYLEVFLTQYISAVKLGPKFLSFAIVPGKAQKQKSNQKEEMKIEIGFIVQEKWDMTLKTYKEQYPILFSESKGKIKQDIVTLIRNYIDNRLIHMDIKPENVVIKVDEQNHFQQLTFIDFGWVQVCSSETFDQAFDVMWDQVKQSHLLR